MSKCNYLGCRSIAFNLQRDGIEQGDLCDVHYWKDRFVESDQMVKKLSAENGALRERIDDLIAGDVMHEPNWSN